MAWSARLMACWEQDVTTRQAVASGMGCWNCSLAGVAAALVPGLAVGTSGNGCVG